MIGSIQAQFCLLSIAMGYLRLYLYTERPETGFLRGRMTLKVVQSMNHHKFNEKNCGIHTCVL